MILKEIPPINVYIDDKFVDFANGVVSNLNSESDFYGEFYARNRHDGGTHTLLKDRDGENIEKDGFGVTAKERI